MKTVFIISCLFVMAFAAPAPPKLSKLFKVPVQIPSEVEVEASDLSEAIRKARQIVDVDIDIINGGGGNYGGGYGGGYGGYNGGYGGGYGGYGGSGYGGYGGYGGCSSCGYYG